MSILHFELCPLFTTPACTADFLLHRAFNWLLVTCPCIYVLVIYVKRSQSECHVVIRHTTKNLSTAGTVPQPSAHLDKLQLFESTRCNKIRAKDENLRDMFTIVGVCTRSHEKLVNFLY